MLAETKHVGAACHDLKDFRETCITGSVLPQQLTRGLVLTVVLQLYAAAYCRPQAAKVFLWLGSVAWICG